MTVFITEEFGSSDFPVSDGTFACLNDASDGDRFKVEGNLVAVNERTVSSNLICPFTRFNLPKRQQTLSLY